MPKTFFSRSFILVSVLLVATLLSARLGAQEVDVATAQLIAERPNANVFS